MNPPFRQLDAALAAFADRDGLIFDARFNHGRSDLAALAELARFAEEWLWPVLFRYKQVRPTTISRTACRNRYRPASIQTACRWCSSSTAAALARRIFL